MRTITLSCHRQIDPETGNISPVTDEYVYASENCLQQHSRTVLVEVTPETFVGHVDHPELGGVYLGIFQGTPQSIAKQLVDEFMICVEAWDRDEPETSCPAEIQVVLHSFPSEGGSAIEDSHLFSFSLTTPDNPIPDQN
jgi:hypothetical protein